MLFRGAGGQAGALDDVCPLLVFTVRGVEQYVVTPAAAVQLPPG